MCYIENLIVIGHSTETIYSVNVINQYIKSNT